MIPAELKRCRKALGLSQNGLGQVLKVHGRTIRRWECGEREIPGPVEVLMLWLACDIDPMAKEKARRLLQETPKQSYTPARIRVRLG